MMTSSSSLLCLSPVRSPLIWLVSRRNSSAVANVRPQLLQCLGKALSANAFNPANRSSWLCTVIRLPFTWIEQRRCGRGCETQFTGDHHCRSLCRNSRWIPATRHGGASADCAMFARLILVGHKYRSSVIARGSHHRKEGSPCQHYQTSRILPSLPSRCTFFDPISREGML